ncbi:MAG: L-histidine N(alpha)-methyltransferase [Nitrosopumilus sp.]|nr:L-histidine N(alpha)-methyltransferase [Nitrosopumilus sp.]
MNETIQNNLNYKKYIIDSRLKYFKPHTTKIENSFAKEISYSLTQDSKFISPKFFYDKKGSDLFEQICSLDEYYPTRTEISILKTIQTQLPLLLGGYFRLVELGSGSAVKTRVILDVFDKIYDQIEYFPIDISEILTESSELLLKNYGHLSITGIIDTYEGGLEFIESFDNKKNLILFLGSSFGNFSPDEGKKFLEKINAIMKHEDLFLIGLDLVKNKSVLENAYDDSKGITAQFNLNVLSRINDELDADFDLANFKHHAIYNEKEQRVEMYLKSLVNQSVIISKSNLSLLLQKDELIHTEYSYKYRLDQIEDMMRKTGFDIKKTWLDENNLFVLILVSKI